MQLVRIQGHCLSNHECDHGRTPTVARLPGEGAIHLLAHLPHKDTFYFPSRRCRELQAINFVKHSLYLQNRRTALSWDVDWHIESDVKREPTIIDQ